jgi:hypothetical protein
MRTARILLAALSLALVAACTAEPVGVVRPSQKPALDGVGVSGSGNSAGTDSTAVSPVDRGGVGVSGSGN